MFKSHIKKNSGFTLIEIIVVVIIVGVLAALAIPNYRAVVDRTKIAEAKSVLLHGYAGYQRLIFDNEPIDASNQLNWSRMGMPNADTMTNRYFDYSIRPNANNPTSLRATFIRDNTKYVQVSLSDGTLTVVNF